MNICCYHGTDRTSSTNILSRKQFIVKNRSDHWLGNGAYFFVGDFEKARWWARSHSRRIKGVPVVLCMQIEIRDDELLNLNIESDFYKLEDFSDELFKSLENEGFFLKFEDNHERNCFVLDKFFEEYPEYKAVRRTFPATNKYVGASGFNMLSDQICIMDQSIIPFSQIEIKNVG